MQYHFPGDGMPTADFCNEPEVPFPDVASFIPGDNVTITCSFPSGTVLWTSPLFPNDPVILNPALSTCTTRVDGVIVFNLTSFKSESKCATTTATIANINESMQGLSLTCTNGHKESEVIIDLTGKLILKNYHNADRESGF